MHQSQGDPLPPTAIDLPEAVEDLAYEVLLELPVTERKPAFLALLAAHPEHHDALRTLERRLGGAESALQDTGLSEAPPPQCIGPYQLLRQLGRGGFGVVWLAEQKEPLKRQVALKLIRRGMDTAAVLRRFEAERELMARFDHPCIARVLDAGQTPGGEPFLVTELVAGEPLAAFCERQGLSLRARIELFLRVCEGVQHAHQRGVMHRDLKPSNVLVAEVDGIPSPKIIDFGIARAMHGSEANGLTRAGTLLGTPEYMSPEQACGSLDVDIRTDVYALGIMLYELLVGDLPHGRRRWQEAGLAELIDLIRSGDPVRPSTHASVSRQGILRRELDWVVLAATNKDRESRYGTVAELARDLRAFLDDRPIAKGPPSLWYLGRKFMRRHRLQVVAAAVMLLSLLTGLVVSLQLYRESQRSAAVAQQHLDDYQRVAGVVRLRELQASAKALWPATPANATAYLHWLDAARSLQEQRPAVAASLLLSEARSGGQGADADAARFLVDVLRNHLDELAAMAAPDGLIAGIEQRLSFAQVVEQRTLVEPAAAWQQAIRDIAASERYGGLTLTPQLGLVPLGIDPDSGLYEFLHLQSGRAPMRDGRGRIVPDKEMGIVLVLVPGGEATIGAQSTDPAAPRHDPAASARARMQNVLLQPFFIARYEMTRAQWERCIGARSWYFPVGTETGSGPLTDLHPAMNLSFEEAAEAMRQLDLELPTDAQWEYACRAGSDSVWFCGDDPRSVHRHGNVAGREIERLDGGRVRFSPEHMDGFALTAPVGSFLPNAFGLFDTIGNVCEVCAESVVDHEGPLRPGDGFRLHGDPERAISVRGGTFSDPLEAARSAAWSTVSPGSRVVQLGIRPARSLRP